MGPATVPCCSAASYRQSRSSHCPVLARHTPPGAARRLLAGAKSRATGTLAGRARTSDIIDANVVEGALRRGDLIVSSGEGDLAAIAAAVGRRMDIDRP